jgi:hypothetical protein
MMPKLRAFIDHVKSNPIAADKARLGARGRPNRAHKRG